MPVGSFVADLDFSGFVELINPNRQENVVARGGLLLIDDNRLLTAGEFNGYRNVCRPVGVDGVRNENFVLARLGQVGFERRNAFAFVGVVVVKVVGFNKRTCNVVELPVAGQSRVEVVENDAGEPLFAVGFANVRFVFGRSF